MKLGLCGPLDRAETAREMGYDYLEPALSTMAAMEEEAFDAACERVKATGLPVEAVNVLLPGTLPLTGDAVDMTAIGTYLDKAFSRAARLGVKVIVFGSGGARKVPEGFDRDKAQAQIGDFLRLCDAKASAYGFLIAIEPLCKKECNILNTVAEATALARSLNLKTVGVLGDIYHMAMEEEPVQSLVDAGPLLYHMHIANPQGRSYPRKEDAYDYAAVFAALRAAGYKGRMSVEVGEPFGPVAKEALSVLAALQG